jgi:uncharacterized protein (DUF488 family)
MEEFIDVLKAHDIKRVVDVRRFPGSKKFPHFNKDNIEKVLPQNGIEYFYLGDLLGGFRKEGYKNYTKTRKFKEGIKKLLNIAKSAKVAIMCTEALWFRCHRRYISDELSKLDHDVIHIIDGKRIYEHRISVKT